MVHLQRQYFAHLVEFLQSLHVVLCWCQPRGIERTSARDHFHTQQLTSKLFWHLNNEVIDCEAVISFLFSDHAQSLHLISWTCKTWRCCRYTTMRQFYSIFWFISKFIIIRFGRTLVAMETMCPSFGSLLYAMNTPPTCLGWEWCVLHVTLYCATQDPKIGIFRYATSQRSHMGTSNFHRVQSASKSFHCSPKAI